MKRLFFCCSNLLFLVVCFAQTKEPALKNAWSVFMADSQMRSASASLYVMDAGTGKTVFDANGTVGLAPASTQKIFTATTAFALLRPGFRYQTIIGYDIGINNNILKGNLYVEGAGDPTLGSPRWGATTRDSVMKKIVAALKNKNINQIAGDVWIDDLRFGPNPVPDGWIWQDMGNYYGAGSFALSWNENQYDLLLKPGEVGGQATVIGTIPFLKDLQITNLVRTAEKGTGDNTYLYTSPYSKNILATGTIPAGVESFKVSGSIPNPALQFGEALKEALKAQQIKFAGTVKLYSDSVYAGKPIRKMMRDLDSISSPTLEQMTYWFLRKSINLYGEAFLKTIAYEKLRDGNTAKGLVILKNFWKEQGLDPVEINMVDGSGLSPENRVTTHAQVVALQYARGQTWFKDFYEAMPEYNGMKMKSGTISGAKAFCGYQHGKDGHDYVFSIIVNNYNGATSALVRKMYTVLDQLK